MICSSRSLTINLNSCDSRAPQISQSQVESINLGYRMNAEVTSPSTSNASCQEPEYKKVKLETSDESLEKKKTLSVASKGFYTAKKLEDRIGGILCCTVCLDLPQTSIYQCSNGHLMCAGCFAHLLADARLKDEQATCPNCRCEISKQSCCRNLAVEKTVSELPANCLHCDVMYPRNFLDYHQKEECMERPAKCKYNQIGCSWEGPYHELDSHSQECAHPNRPAKDIMEFLHENNSKVQEEQNVFNQLVNFLSFEKVCFNDLQFKQYKTDEITPKLYFETNRFNAFFHQWVLKARVNDNQKNPNLTLNRYISFQLVLKSKLSNSNASFPISFCAMKGPFGEVPIKPRVHTFEFSHAKTETDFIKLNIKATDCNKLLASKTINFRFFMFQP